jgi:cell division protein FtsL
MSNRKESFFEKLLLGVLIVVVSALILHFIGINDKGETVTHLDPPSTQKSPQKTDRSDSDTPATKQVKNDIQGIWSISAQEKGMYRMTNYFNLTWEIKLVGSDIQIYQITQDLVYGSSKKEVESSNFQQNNKNISFTIFENYGFGASKTDFDLRFVDKNIMEGTYTSKNYDGIAGGQLDYDSNGKARFLRAL